jgi:hypothetical protein
MNLSKIFHKHTVSTVILVDFAILCLSFLIPVWIKPGSVRIVPAYIFPFLVFSFLWIILSLFSGKYNLKNIKNQGHLIALLSINTFLALSGVSILMFAFKIIGISRAIVLGTILLCYVLEIVLFRALYIFLQEKVTISKSAGKNSILENIEQHHTFESEDTFSESYMLKKKIIDRKLLISNEAGEKVYDYFAEHVKIDDESIVLTATTTPFNIINIPNDNIASIVNLKKVNGIKDLNLFFKSINSKLRYSGIYIGCVETSKERFKRIETKFPPFARELITIFDFVLNRIIPKVFVIKNIYFNLTAGVKMYLSKAEVLGRLVSCGFEIIEYKEINNLTYFVVIKTAEPVSFPSVSYGPLLKVPRVGKNGKIIHVYKFRTMYPFSEYLHDYVLQLNGYSIFGRPANDFRLTDWGKFLHKFMLDDIPQIINVIRGEMSLVGIKPLSKKDLEFYPKDLKELRKKYKPGCIPPYVALLKQGIFPSIEAERKYLNEKERNGITTDFKYLGLALYNLITNKIKST